MMKDSKGDVGRVVYILYYKGVARVVSKDAWERSWLNWYNKIN